MTAKNEIIDVRDSTQNGAPVTGLTPTWRHLKLCGTNATVTQPAITELLNGQYAYTIDAAALGGDVYGQIDAGAAVPYPGDRYISVFHAAS